MYLVRYDQDSVACADLSKFFQRLTWPEYADRVVGVAQYKYLRAFVEQAFEPFEVHPVTAVLVYEGILDGHAAKPLGIAEERVIYRCLDDYFVAGFGEGQVGLVYRGDDTGAETDPVALDIEAVTAPLPVPDGILEIVRHGGVTDDVPVDALPQGGAYGGIGLEIHVGDPHCKLSLLGAAVFYAPCPGPVEDFVEVPARGLGLLFAG